MILVDSSIWIALDRGGLAVGQLVGDEIVATCPAIVLEVLRGTTRPKQHEFLRETLMSAHMLDSSVPFERFEDAVRVYQQCRAKAVTVRSSIDCLVAATAIHYAIPILHNDRDFRYIAEVLPLDVRTITRRS